MGCMDKEDRYEAWNVSEMVVTCDPVSRMDSHCTPSMETVAAQRGPIRLSSKLELVLLSDPKFSGTGSSLELCFIIMGLVSSLLSAPGCPTAGAASSLKPAENLPGLSDISHV